MGSFYTYTATLIHAGVPQILARFAEVQANIIMEGARDIGNIIMRGADSQVNSLLDGARRRDEMTRFTVKLAEDVRQFDLNLAQRKSEAATDASLRAQALAASQRSSGGGGGSGGSGSGGGRGSGSYVPESGYDPTYDDVGLDGTGFVDTGASLLPTSQGGGSSGGGGEMTVNGQPYTPPQPGGTITTSSGEVIANDGNGEYYDSSAVSFDSPDPAQPSQGSSGAGGGDFWT